MPKDYAHRSRTTKRKNPKKRSPYRLLLIILLLIALIISGTLYFLRPTKSTPPLKHSANLTNTPGVKVETATPITNVPVNHAHTLAQQQTITTTIANQIQPRKIKFDFYQMLPKMKVTIANNNVNSQQQSHNIYIIQLGSFTNLMQAQAFKQQIQTTGFKPQIRSIPENNIIWYRVQLGPFTSKQKASDMRDELQRQNINCILLSISN